MKLGQGTSLLPLPDVTPTPSQGGSGTGVGTGGRVVLAGLIVVVTLSIHSHEVGQPY